MVVGLGAGLAVGAPFRLDTALGCLLVALLLQVVANFANDLSDFRRGADTADRPGPLRVAAAGLVTERQLEVAIAVDDLLAGLVGLWLVSVGGWVLVALGLLAVVAALAYTGGPFPYGYRALGEVFVFLFFGLVAVAGTAYLQALRFDALFVVAAIPPGALITAILVVNNLRDIPTDAAAGKRTLAVVLGARRTQAEYGALLGIAYVVPVMLVLAWMLAPAGRRPVGGRVRRALPLLTLPLVRPLLRTVAGSASRASSTRCSRGPPGCRWCSRCCSAWGSRSAAGRAREATAVTSALGVRRVRVPFRVAVRDRGRHVGGARVAARRLRTEDGRAGWGRRRSTPAPRRRCSRRSSERLLDGPDDGVPEDVRHAFGAGLDGARLDLAAPPEPAASAVRRRARQRDDRRGLGRRTVRRPGGRCRRVRHAQAQGGRARDGADARRAGAAVRAAVGPGVALRLDVNGTWTLDEADGAARGARRRRLQYVEQPLAAGRPARRGEAADARRRRDRGGRGGDVARGGRALLEAGRGRRARRQAGAGRRARGGGGDRGRRRPSTACRSSCRRCWRRASGWRRRSPAPRRCPTCRDGPPPSGPTGWRRPMCSSTTSWRARS